MRPSCILSHGNARRFCLWVLRLGSKYNALPTDKALHLKIAQAYNIGSITDHSHGLAAGHLLACG